MTPAARVHVVEAPPGLAVLGWALVGVSLLPMILLPLAAPTLLTPGFLAVALGAVLLILWLTQVAFVRARLSVTVDDRAGTVRIAGPLSSRVIPLADIDSLRVDDDDGQNRGVVNWPVTGRAASRRGVRLNLGGSAALIIETHRSGARPRERITVVAENTAAAIAMWEDIERAMGGRGPAGGRSTGRSASDGVGLGLPRIPPRTRCE